MKYFKHMRDDAMLNGYLVFLSLLLPIKYKQFAWHFHIIYNTDLKKKSVVFIFLGEQFK